MLYRRFEEVPVWNDAIELIRSIHSLVRLPGFPDLASLRSQLERATLSISNNIAEGFERGTHEELLTFLYIARGSSGEVRSMIAAVHRLSESLEVQEHTAVLASRAESISRQLGRWIESIKDSSRRGARYQTRTTRQQAENQRRAQDFTKSLQQIVEQGRREQNPPPENLESK